MMRVRSTLLAIISLVLLTYERCGYVLVTGTQKDNLVFWKNQAVGNESPSDSESWKALCHTYILFEAQVDQLSIGENNVVIAIHFGGQVALVTETVIRGCMTNIVKLLQTYAYNVQVYIQNDIANKMFLIETKGNIKSLDCSD